MLSKSFIITSDDLTSGEYLADITITKTFTASNNTRSEIWYPTTCTSFNYTGHNIGLVFLTSGELSEYQTDRTNFGNGVVIGWEDGNCQQYEIKKLARSKWLNFISSGSLDHDFNISFFNYYKG